MYENERLTQIVKEVQKDKGQFELLYSHIINKIYFWCFMIVGNESDAKDASQEVIIRIYRNLDALKTPEYFQPWMYRIAKNYCVSYLQRHKKHETEYYHDDAYDESSDVMVKEKRTEYIPHKAFDLKETKLLLRGFIDKLPRMQKEVIILFYLEEMKVNEIAEALDYNEGSVKSRLYSGRKNLEVQINKYQKKHNIKLYSMALLPLLLLLFQEYEAEVCARQELSYDKSKFEKPKIKKIPKKSIIIGTLVASVVTSLLLLNSSNKDIAKTNAVGLTYNKNNLLVDKDKKGWVTVSGGELSERGGKTSITYTFEVADAPLTALQGHIYWDSDLMEYDSITKNNVNAWGDTEEGHLEFINIDGTESGICSITIYFKNVLPESLPEKETLIRFEFEDSTSIYQSDRELITFAGGDYLAMEPDEVVIPVDVKVKYVPNEKVEKSRK